MTLGLRLSVPLEGPLRLPCHPHSASGFRFPASDCRRVRLSSNSRPSPFFTKWSISGRFQHGCLPVIQQHSRKATVVRASGDPGSSPRPVVGPAELKTPTGQVLSEIMRSRPHLLSLTIDKELKKLCLDRDVQEKEAASRSLEKILYKRMAELNEKERRQAIEDIMYCLIVQKFGDRDIYMTPKIFTSSSPEAVTLMDFPNGPKLGSVFSPDALEMVECHITMILCSGILGVGTTLPIIKLKLGKLYATSIMFGYCLKRIDERYQLELTMNTLPKVKNFPNMFNGINRNPFWPLDSLVRITRDDGDGFGKAGDAKDGDYFGKAGDAKDGDDFGKAGYSKDGAGFEKAGDAKDGDGFGKAGVTKDSDGFGKAEDAKEKDCSLMGYVWYMDTETLLRYATIRSNEAGAVIEKQREALFGPPDIVVSGDGVPDEIVTVTSQGLISLMAEATVFGSFLWEAEEYIENKYHIV